MSRASSPWTRALPRSRLTWLLVLATAVTSVWAALPDDADARGFRRSRFRSSRRSWSHSSRRSTYKPRTRARPTRRYKPRTQPTRRYKPRSTRTNRRRRATTTRRGSRSPFRVGRRGRRLGSRSRGVRTSRWLGTPYSPSQAYRRAARVGLAFATVELARAHFRSHHQGEYPVSFPTEPRARPAYVPETTRVNKESRPVVWDARHTRYAVQRKGELVPYDPLADKAVGPRVMARAGYYWGPKPVASRVRSSRARRGGVSWIVVLVVGALLFVFFLIIGLILRMLIRKALKPRAGPGGTALARRGKQALLPPPPPRQHEPDHPDYWLYLQPGDLLAVNDMQAFEDVLEGAHGSSYGIDFQVQSTQRMRSATNHWEAVLCELKHLEQQPGEQPLWLLAWRERGATTLSVYYAPEGFTPGTRADLLDREETWLFEEPTRDDWRPNELRINAEVEHVGTRRDGSEEAQRFGQLPGGPAVGGLTAEPGPRILEAVQVVRWRCDTAEKNPLMLLIERGGTGRMEGGTLRLLLGTEVRGNELDVTPGGAASSSAD